MAASLAAVDAPVRGIQYSYFASPTFGPGQIFDSIF